MPKLRPTIVALRCLPRDTLWLIAAAVLGYWLNRALFSYVRPDGYFAPDSAPPDISAAPASVARERARTSALSRERGEEQTAAPAEASAPLRAGPVAIHAWHRQVDSGH